MSVVPYILISNCFIKGRLCLLSYFFPCVRNGRPLLINILVELVLLNIAYFLYFVTGCIRMLLFYQYFYNLSIFSVQLFRNCDLLKMFIIAVTRVFVYYRLVHVNKLQTYGIRTQPKFDETEQLTALDNICQRCIRAKCKDRQLLIISLCK